MDDVGDSKQKISYGSLSVALEIIAKAKQQRTFKTPNTTSSKTSNTDTNKDVTIHFTRYSASPSLPDSVYVFLNIN